MALIVDSYPDPTDPTTPISNAYAWVFHIGLNMGLGTYWVEVWIHRNEAAASVYPPPPPLARLTIEPGTILIPGVPGIPEIPPVEARPAVEEDLTADPPVYAQDAVEAQPGVPGVPEIPAVLAPSLTEVFDLAAAAQESDPSLTPLLAFRKVVYDLIATHHLLSPNTVV